MVSLCSTEKDTSTDMHIDLLRSPLDLCILPLGHMRPKFGLDDLDLSGSKHTCFDAARREKHDGDRIIALTFFVQSVFPKKKHMAVDLPQKTTVDLRSSNLYH